MRTMVKIKKSIGKNFTDYKIKKVSDIVGYKGEKQILEYLKKYELPNANLILRIFKRYFEELIPSFLMCSLKTINTILNN